MEVKEEVIDPKAKAPPKGQAVVKESIFTEEEETTYGNRKIFVEYKPDLEEQTEISFKLKVLYQGPEYEDPNPQPIEEIKKPAAAKGKNAPVVVEEPLIKMIKPEAVLLK